MIFYFPRRLLAFGGITLLAPVLSHADNIGEMTVQGHYDNEIGASDAASQGAVTSNLIEARPALRPGEVLEFVPGVIVTQHSGDGKANQYFLRGFNLDHGTDFATFVDGIPVNMRSHAHGQGYTDLNFLIPELIDRIDYKKGPYYADEGDFASAGAAHIRLADSLDHGVVTLTGGDDSFARALLANSNGFHDGHLLYALETGYNDGPWDHGEHFRKFNGVLRYSEGARDDGYSVTAMGYDARWRSTDQIPERAVKEGLISRFGALDPSDGGETARYSLSANWVCPLAGGVFRADGYALQSRLRLFSDFTYFLDDPVNGDQFEQAEHRNMYGFDAGQLWTSRWGAFDVTYRIGLQTRYDRLDPVGLYATEDRELVKTISRSKVSELSGGLYAENTVRWTDGFKTVVGLRTDQYRFHVNSNISANTGTATDHITSPKLSMIFGPWNKTEFFANYGEGFHSNDARGATERLTPKELLPAAPVTPLVKTRGGELGVRTAIVPGLESSLALWRLNVGSELVFSGDAGDTEPSRPSRRYGVEWGNHYIAESWLLFDLDVSVSHARFTQFDPVGQYIPGSIDKVASFGVSVADLGPWFGQLQIRYFGPRPLLEDDSVESRSTTLTNLRVGYKIRSDLQVRLDVFNLLNTAASDIDYYYASRLPGEPAAGVNDIHFHPVEPRSYRLSISYSIK